MIVVIDGRLTNARPQEGGDDHINPQRIWSFTVDDGSGGVAVIAAKAQVLPMLACMEAAAPVYIVARLRFVHEIAMQRSSDVGATAQVLSSMLGWPRQADDLVCEVLRAGPSEGIGLRADDTPEAQDEERSRQHAEQMAAIATDGMADVPSPSVKTMQAKLQEQAQAATQRYAARPVHLPPASPLKTADQLTTEQYNELWNAIDSDSRFTTNLDVTKHHGRVVAARVIAEKAIASFTLTAEYPGGLIADAMRHGANALLLDARRLGLHAELTIMVDAQGAVTIRNVQFIREKDAAIISGQMLLDDAKRWLHGYTAALASQK
jgi:hypothetical protein